MAETHATSPTDAKERLSWREEWRVYRLDLVLALGMLGILVLALVGGGR